MTTAPAALADNPPLVDAYDEDKLPESYRALFREDAPLPNATLFIPRRRTWTSVLFTLVLSSAAVVFGLLLMVAWFFLDRQFNSHGVAGTNYFSWVLCGGLIFVLGGGLWGYSLKTKVRGIRAERAGRPLRYGLFLTPEGALERRDVGFTMVPRERVRGVLRETSGAARLVFTGADGAEKGVTFSADLGDPAAVADALNRWLAAR